MRERGCINNMSTECGTCTRPPICVLSCHASHLICAPGCFCASENCDGCCCQPLVAVAKPLHQGRPHALQQGREHGARKEKRRKREKEEEIERVVVSRHTKTSSIGVPLSQKGNGMSSASSSSSSSASLLGRGVGRGGGGGGGGVGGRGQGRGGGGGSGRRSRGSAQKKQEPEPQPPRGDGEWLFSMQQIRNCPTVQEGLTFDDFIYFKNRAYILIRRFFRGIKCVCACVCVCVRVCACVYVCVEQLCLCIAVCLFAFSAALNVVFWLFVDRHIWMTLKREPERQTCPS